MGKPSMTLIKTVTVGAGGASNIDLTGIPNTFTDLQVVWSTRDNVAGNQNNLQITFNGSTTGYSERIIYGNGSSAAALSQSATNIGFAYSTGTGATANTFSSGQMLIPNYASNLLKTASIEVVGETAATSALQVFNAALWSNTAAINRITLTSNGGILEPGSTASVYGISKLDTSFTAKATGGTITADANYVYHTFKASGTFTPLQSLTADALIIAGGGGAYGNNAGGGGAGGLLYLPGQSLSSAVSVTVGAGGVNGGGNNSSVTGMTAAVGGGAYGGSGGSGSGAGGVYGAGAGTPGQGYAGGNFWASGDNTGGGGGGGAGGAGANGDVRTGGIGSYSYAAWALATNTGVGGYYAGGGGGHGYNSWNSSWFPGAGGAGGGGAGQASAAPATATPGTANTGGGGGGGYNFYYGGAGGSGLVIVRYLK